MRRTFGHPDQIRDGVILYGDDGEHFRPIKVDADGKILLPPVSITNLQFFRKRRPLHWKDTGVGTTFHTFDPKAPHKLLEIRFKTTALAAGEDFTITKTATSGPNYHDVILFFEELGDLGTLDLTIPFGADEGFMTEADSLVFALSANTGADRWGLEVVYELV